MGVFLFLVLASKTIAENKNLVVVVVILLQSCIINNYLAQKVIWCVHFSDDLDNHKMQVVSACVRRRQKLSDLYGVP